MTSQCMILDSTPIHWIQNRITQLLDFVKPYLAASIYCMRLHIVISLYHTIQYTSDFDTNLRLHLSVMVKQIQARQTQTHTLCADPVSHHLLGTRIEFI